MTFSVLACDCLEGLKTLPDSSVQSCVTSPPYWGLRNYGTPGEIGGERMPFAYLERLTLVFREVRRVLRSDGVLWLNLGDSYANDNKWGGSSSGIGRKEARDSSGRGRRVTGLKPKELCGLPWRVALALREDGWFLRADVIWAKSNPLPEAVKDRPHRAHEYVFQFTKSDTYAFDNNPTADGALRSVWTIAVRPGHKGHPAGMPLELAERLVLTSSKPGELVLDPFAGSGTTGVAALQNGRSFLGFELNPAFAKSAQERMVSTLGVRPISQEAKA